MPKMKYTQEQKAEVYKLYQEGVPQPEIAERLDMPIHSVRTFITRMRQKVKEGYDRQAQADKPRTKQEQAATLLTGASYNLVGATISEILEQNKDEVEKIVVDSLQARTDEMVQKLSEMVLLATDKSIETIKKGPGPKEAKSYWLKSLIGAIAQGVEKYQLIAGKPTGRLEQQGQVTQRYEYDILHKVEQYSDIYTKLASRNGGAFPSFDEGDDIREPMDTGNTDTQTS